MKIGVSSCLLGYCCKYDGKSNYNANIIDLTKEHELIPICPEVLGGLSIPRFPAEIINDRVINTNGDDVTKNYYLGAKKALENGYTSVMYDGSHEDFATNYQNSMDIVKLAKKYNASVEVEVGSIGGEEDGIIGDGEIADPEQAKQMAELGIDFLAAGIGNIHGPYPSN